jgi:hypothetical protein
MRPLFLLLLPCLAVADAPSSSKEGLQPLHDLVGTWKGTGTPFGTREEQTKGFWSETIACEWRFDKDDARLRFAFEKSKTFRSADLRFDPAAKTYRFAAETSDGKKEAYTGDLEGKTLSLLHEDGASAKRLVFTFLHSNRFLYRLESKAAGKTTFAKQFQVGATKEGVPFVAGDGKPECIVSGGLGSMPVMFRGRTYYVCCSGCRDEFNADPEKYVKEFESKKAKK